METLFQLPPVISALVFVVGTLVLALAAYWIARMALCRGDDVKTDLASSVVTRVGALHSLILALVFAQELLNVRDIVSATGREAVLVGDAFYDLERFDPVATLAQRIDLATYVRIVVEEEWELLADVDSLHPDAWAAWERAYIGALELEPRNERQDALKAIIVSHLREVSALRRTRENAAIAHVQDLFMVAAFAGLVLTAAGFFPHEPNVPNLFLVSVFSAFTGLVVFFVVAFANPYHPPGMVKPTGFERLFVGEVAKLAQ